MGASAAVAGGIVYVGTYNGWVDALDGATGEVEWSTVLGGPEESSPAVSVGMLYVWCDDEKLYAFGRRHGGAPVQVALPASVYFSPAVANGVVYVGSHAPDAAMGAREE